MKLVAATGNAGKLREFKRILQPLGIEVLSPADCGVSPEVEETGATFMENASLKAREMHRRTGLPAFADDSGLCVDALGGRPGVYSARYRGEGAPYGDKIAALLHELECVPREKRSAHFACAVCCVLDEKNILRAEGACEGEIGDAPRGDGGFGYDPIFYVNGKSFAELEGEEKDRLSHRGKALRAFAALLEGYMEKGQGEE